VACIVEVKKWHALLLPAKGSKTIWRS